jgi:hypothetical protein
MRRKGAEADPAFMLELTPGESVHNPLALNVLELLGPDADCSRSLQYIWGPVLTTMDRRAYPKKPNP